MLIQLYISYHHSIAMTYSFHQYWDVYQKSSKRCIQNMQTGFSSVTIHLISFVPICSYTQVKNVRINENPPLIQPPYYQKTDFCLKHIIYVIVAFQEGSLTENNETLYLPSFLLRKDLYTIQDVVEYIQRY